MSAPHDELPRRPRRRLVTPVTLALTGVLIAALGFIGGVQVQKSQGSASTVATARSGNFARGFGSFGAGAGAGGGGGGGGGSSNATVGSVANVDGHTFYVTDSSGATVKVKTDSNSKITRTAVASVSAIHPGDTVVVQGTKSSSGTVTASSVTATAKNAGGGLAGLFSGGNPPAGG